MTHGLAGRTDLERAAWIHGALVLVTAGLLELPGGPPWPATAPENLLHVLALPSLLLAPWLLLRRRTLAAAVQLASLAVGLALFAGPLAEELAGPGEPGGTEVRGDLRIVQFNLGVGLAPAAGVAELLGELEPDLVVLVEVTRRFASELDPLVAERYPHRVFHPGGIDGKGLLSRHPIRDEELFRLEDGRPYLRAVIDVGGRRLDLRAVHFSPTIGILDRGAAAGRDLDQVIGELDSRGATVLAGDFNTTERSPAHARLEAAGFRDSFAEVGVGLGRTFPRYGRYFGFPIGSFLRIDYVWHGAALAARRAWVGPDLGSDHLPLVVDLDWRSP